MSLKQFSELKKGEQEQVKVMYSDLTDMEQYLYNFDDNDKYIGREYIPPSGKDEKVGIFGIIRADPLVEEKESEELAPEVENKKVKKIAKKK